MGNLKDVFYEMIGHMNEDQYETFREIHEKFLKEKVKPLGPYDKFNLAAKIISYKKTVNKKSH
tara:strand:+ start:220 stop:408 length:189 start_codon:yes stop_codon:yes gene_type:complete